MNSLVSICIPAYNNEAYIKETIHSVLNQTYTNFELIVVDDCSTDNTWAIIKEFTDKRLRTFKNDKNLGMHGNWQKALSLASGVYIKLLCGDDLIYPECILLQVKSFEDPTNSDVAMVSCKRQIITSKGEPVGGSFYKLFPGKYSGSQAMRYSTIFGTNLIGEPMSVLFRASVFKTNNIQLGSNNYLIDLDLYSKILKHGKILVLKNVLAAFRIYSTSMSGSLGWKHARMFKEFIHEDRFKKDFALTWYHLIIGTFVTYSITLARNIIFKLKS
jgi:glycosyltransferase involved in cell wall biosynthesis